MKAEKNPYEVDVYKYGERNSIPFRSFVKTIKTYAVSSLKAESNARYRTEGRSGWCEEHGVEGNWYSYDYVSRML